MRPTGWPGLAFRRWLAAAIVLAAIAVSMTGVAGGWALERTLASPSSVSAEYPVSQPVFGRATATAGFPAAAAIGGVSLVAWQEESAVVGTLVSPSGKVLIRLGIAVAPGGGQAPDVAAGAGQYLVAWSGDNV